ncbi:MAG: YidC/Oxa1 family insertase periplasmic-domain containing protein, partial [Phycisphaeraceae bacterium]|nr:YidC/Oxa1 family insertase periplasmic-domain containing protein [Phycisphaeraceae bacterium]
AAPAPAPAASNQPDPSKPAPSGPVVAPAPDQPAAQPAAPPVAKPTLVVRRSDDTTPYAPIGALDPDTKVNPFTMQVNFSPSGAGIESLQLARHFQHIGANAAHEVLQRVESHEYVIRDADGNVARQFTRAMVPMAMLGVTIDGTYVDLSDASSGRIWRQTAPGRFEVTILDDADRPVARISRAYELKPGRYAIDLRQSFENLSGRDLSVQWYQLGPGDLPATKITYGGDVRRLRLGVLEGPTSNPNGQVVTADKHLIPHQSVVGSPTDAAGLNWTDYTVWPQADAAAAQRRLVWAGLTNRYFAVAVHAPMSGPGAAKRPDGLPDKSFALVQTLDRVVLAAKGGFTPAEQIAGAVIALRLASAPMTVPAGATRDASMGLYAGPITHAAIDGDPELVAAGIDGLVIYTYGGPCAFCTFQPITHFLRWFLGFLHNFIVFDWALAVMVLVVCVRTVLHPVTRWSQTNLQRFGKQMAAIAPKQQKIREKFADDPKRMREEIAKLMREENINYAGALGCLPMFLQMPIWIALYAMISFTFELRHEGAFFGLIQSLTGGKWIFLGDLAEPDNFIPLGVEIHIPLLSSLMGAISAINIIPLLLGVVFYIQQKYMSPPSSATLTPEQESQQKIMKVMMVVLFPVFMYNAPSALSLYFVVNSTLGILESKWIRQRLEEEDKRLAALGPKAKPPPKPGFWARLQQQVELRQKMLEEQRKQREREQRGRKR